MTIRVTEWRFTWPNGAMPILAELTDLPLLHVTVTTPHDQARLHRELAKRGYVPELIESGADTECWRFYHPDGVRP